MIYFASRTGNVRHIVSRLALPNTEIQAHTVAQAPFLLFTYTDGLGEVPSFVARFMEHSHAHCKGLVISGNSNFGHEVFCGAGDRLAALYGIPVVRKIELRGFSKDDEAIKEFYEKRIVGEKLSEIK